MQNHSDYNCKDFVNFTALKMCHDFASTPIISVKKILFYLTKVFALINWVTFIFALFGLIFIFAGIAEYVLKYYRDGFVLIITAAVFAGVFCLLYVTSFLSYQTWVKKQFLFLRKQIFFLQDLQILINQDFYPVVLNEILNISDVRAFYRQKKKTGSLTLSLAILWMSQFLNNLKNDGTTK